MNENMTKSKYLFSFYYYFIIALLIYSYRQLFMNQLL